MISCLWTILCWLGVCLDFLSRMEDALGSMVRKLVLTKEEAYEVVLPASLAEKCQRQFLLVGGLLTPIPYRKESLMGTFRALWSPKKNFFEKPRVVACALDGCDHILFSFTHEYDWKRALHGSPWHFNKALFAIAPWKGGPNPCPSECAVFLGTCSGCSPIIYG